MASRSLNKVQIIGNLTRDPELRYTPQGTAVCTFGLATNRAWTTDTGEKKEQTDFHRIVAWNKLAEICSQLLSKGRRVYVEGRLSTRSWTGQDGQQRQTTEIIISDMIILDSKGVGALPVGEAGVEVPEELAPEPVADEIAAADAASPIPENKEPKKAKGKAEKKREGDEDSEEMPF